MPRAPRVHHPGGHYHVTLRGNHRQPIFDEPGDRDRWEQLMAESLTRTGAAIHAYCWMTNHVHMVVQVGQTPLEGLVRRVASRYARWYQRRIPTTGHLFERRYWAQPVLSDEYMLAVVRYIHFNPVRAALVREVAEYPWSSHGQYAACATAPWLTTRFVLGLFHDDPAQARRGYLAYMAEDPGELAPQDATAAEEPSVGPAPTRAGVDDAESETLASLVDRIAAEHGLTLATLCSSAREHRVARVRALVAWHATSTGAATLTEVARLLGRTPATLVQTLGRLRVSQPDLFGQAPRPWKSENS